MTAENTRAALPGDLVAQLRAVRVTTPHGDGVPLLNAMAADALAARDAEIARLRADCETWAAEFNRAMGEAQRLLVALDLLEMHAVTDIAPHWYAVPAGEWEQVFPAALSPPPASDGDAP
jgi:hypothetical protein